MPRSWRAQTFYTPDLTPFVVKLRAAGIPIFTAMYNRSLERDDDDVFGTVPLYSASVMVPHTGHVIEVVSEHLDDDNALRLKAPFDHWPGRACPKAMEVLSTVGDMRRAWIAAGGSMSNGLGMPDLLVVKIAFPGSTTKFMDFISKVARDTTDTVTFTTSEYQMDDDVGLAPGTVVDATKALRAGAHGGGHELDAITQDDDNDDRAAINRAGDDGADGADDDDSFAGEQLCRWASVNLNGFLADLRAIESPAARVGARSVEMWSGYADALHARWTGDDAGWDRLLDNHVGFEVAHGFLDEFVDGLRAHNISFRAHSDNQGIGSIWTGGIGGQGVELHGIFDFSVLDKTDITDMDYCASPALLGATKRIEEVNGDDGAAMSAADAALARAVAAIRGADASGAEQR